MVCIKLFVIIFGTAYCYPSLWVQKIAENSQYNTSTSASVTTTSTISSTVSSTTIPSKINQVPDENKIYKNTFSNKIKNISEEIDDLNIKASQEANSSEESEEGGNMLTGLLSAFLGGLSKPDGSIDLEAIIGLLGSLSTQNPDGTYDFDGLTQLLRSFFGGSPDGGGSDIGAFAGGLLGAFIKGVANPPGPKGAGILAGKVVTGILPALSAPETNLDGHGATSWKKEPPLDSGSFLTGLLKTVLGINRNEMGQKTGSKYTLFKLIFSAITGVISAASSLSSKSDWQN
ncbi:uncharacterized protein LOC126744656 isoform X2 [Anthonomus grandis grandis]|uniref:uncharacterized protein LOC126744656 isoform X2 n=1 Tax=Anthonomus grandis grandis TaxID=2921223 RepID=UPI00216685E7|nr:uncharacterized protein LOC126744656 isoform X2 [Anthonomus grandis grandis]